MASLKIALAKAARGGTIAVAIGGAALLATGCASAEGTTQAQAGTAAPATMPEGVVVIGVVDLVSPRLGLVGLGASASGTSGGQARLMLTTNFGRTFTSIGPKTAALTEPDSIFFLGRDHGWFATFSVLTLQEKVYRTSDGGRHWQSFAAPGHNLAGGSADSLQFLNPRDGFLTDVVANAPGESLYRTTDGGATWHLIASLQPERRHGTGVLPELGQTEFAAGGKVGYLGGGMFSHALYRTSDGGRTWRKADMPAPSGSQFGLPALSGQTQAEPVTIHSGGSVSLRTYLSVDGGVTWSPRSVLATPIASCAGPIASDLSHGWAAAVQAHQVLVFRERNQGRSWITLRTHVQTPPGSCGPDQITAPGPRQGWLVVPGPVANGAGTTRIYASADGGKTWQRIDQEALRTPGPA
jgi:photosystem II stability/assembly factor-like uncharacterized protein